MSTGGVEQLESLTKFLTSLTPVALQYTTLARGSILSGEEGMYHTTHLLTYILSTPHTPLNGCDS